MYQPKPPLIEKIIETKHLGIKRYENNKTTESQSVKIGRLTMYRGWSQLHLRRGFSPVVYLTNYPEQNRAIGMDQRLWTSFRSGRKVGGQLQKRTRKWWRASSKI